MIEIFDLIIEEFQQSNKGVFSKKEIIDVLILLRDKQIKTSKIILQKRFKNE